MLSTVVQKEDHHQQNLQAKAVKIILDHKLQAFPVLQLQNKPFTNYNK